MGGKVKKGNYSGGRGYCGWFTKKNGEEVFLRSKLEFIYAKYLDLNNIDFLMEKEIFNINGKKYKPDFFIYKDDAIKKIIEIKGNSTLKEQYLFLYKEFFVNKGIEYAVLCDTDLKDYVKKYDIDINKWIDFSIETQEIADVKGKNNPRYGFHLSEKEKEYQRNLCKKRFEDKAFRIKHQESIREAMTPSVRKKISEARKNRPKKVYEYENKICCICNKIFKVRKNSSINITTCSGKCLHIKRKKEGLLNYSTGSKLHTSYKARLIKESKKFIYNYISGNNLKLEWDLIIDKVKKENIIPKNLGISLNTINKVFSNFDNYLKEF